MPTYAAPAMTCQVRDKTDEYIQDLGSQDPHVRQAACQGLGREGQRPRAVPPLLNGLQDQNSYVRLAAATSLGQAAKKGDDAVLEALIARCSDGDASVRRVACTSVAQVASKSQAFRARSALLARCEDKDGGVRRSAVKALEKVAEKDDSQVLSALLARSSDSEAFVRFSVVEALSNVSAEGNAQVVDRLLELVSDRDSRVGCCSCESLGRLAVRGESRVLTALLGCLEDEADAVRKAAATSLGQVTFAPLQELELQERHIAELEFREQHEVSTRDRTIADLKGKYEKETAELRARVYALEDRLKLEVEKRDAEIAQLIHQMEEQEWIAGVGSVIPHAGEISKFIAKLPELAGAEHYGKQITAPIWALRSMRIQETVDTASTENSMEAKEKRSMLSLFDLFERVSSGSTSPWELTEASPLDVFVHRLEDGTWGLFCSSHQRLLAFMMRQACNRNELMRVRCVLRSKEDLGYWSWHWNCFYDGSDGRTMSPKVTSPQSSPSRRKMGFSSSSPRLAGGSPSTPTGVTRNVRTSRPSPGEIQSTAALAAATSALGAQACVRSPRAFGQAKSSASPSIRRSKSSSTTPSSPRQIPPK